MQPDIYKRVVNAKYVFERAAGMLAETDEMSPSISLLLMHDAVELLMLAILDHLQLVPKKNREFMDFWPLVRDAGHSDAPDRIPMESLNKLRIGLKHCGNLPNPKAVLDLVTRVRGFFENVLQAYCGVNYSDVSLIDLVADSEVRSCLHEAQAKFSSDKREALTSLKIAFHKIEHPDGKRLPFLYPPKEPSLPSEIAKTGLRRYLGELHSFLNESAARTNAAMVGIDAVRYTAFLRNTPLVQWSYSGQPTIIYAGTYDQISETGFEEMLNFLIDYALKASLVYISVPAHPVGTNVP